MPNKSDNKPHHLGHRKRMRKKFLINSAGIFDYELFEILLYYAFPRKDTKKIAKSLLEKFGSVHEVIFATPEDLQEIEGIGPATSSLICVIREIFTRMHLEKVSESTIIASSEHVINYYKNIFWNMKQEQLRVMFVNNKNKLLAEEILQTGTVTQTAVYPREII